MTDTHERTANETSPLVGPDRSADDDNGNPVSGSENTSRGANVTSDVMESKSGWYLFLLTLSIGGLQIVWSVEFSNGSPYLLSLGMSKALLAFVWIAGPLSGSIVQPYIGICSDNCRISWGKRKPFMIVGGAATVVSLLALAWIKEIVGGCLGIFGVDLASAGTKTVVIIFATILMYCLDVAVNTVQAGIRCFIVDNAPAHQQESANAWASRLTGVGNILGYVFGYVELPKYLPFLGNTQFKVLCAVASISLASTLFISCLYIRERDPRLESPPSSGNPGIVAFFRQVFKSIKHLPPQIAKICEVQLAAWVGWFPFLFYATTYIGQLYVNPIFIDHPDLPGEKINEAWEKATRIGTFALLIYAIVSFIANITLPLFVVPTYKPTVLTQDRHLSDGLDGEPFLGNRRTSFPSLAGATASAESPSNSSEGKRKWLSKLQIPGFTLRRAWFLSHVLFAVCMFGTFFVYSYQAATVVVGLVGISWALTLWAPFALISAEVARIDAGYRAKHQQSELDEHYSAPNYHADPPVAEYDLENGSSSTTLKVAEEDENLAQAGIILGLHNVAISAPQILSSLICSAIFKVAQKPRGEAWDDSVGWVLRFGGCGAVLAAWLTSRLVEGRG